ncbi:MULTISPECIES: DUF4249 domain-containing protein [unclassified Arcicella]|uniref:DUF4249 domain-containing protein n=1 Tax=unclassified Arcicella TaxID=2644986 RepID=UPI002855642A|nr:MULTISPECIES: DUF4249 domain-containing protein [unclassified Arcicella]MDR6564369.1 hypothetical protein [Arcicella sp. BE51]MDR6814119.1 hypothetical protein [Arcicella sp. BE140]MDR6825431.1 hypothetical protein [Arcicella sp. BE139]
MKSIIKYIFSIFLSVSLMSCEDVIQLNVPETEKYLVVEGTITNVAGEQFIKLTESQALLSTTTPNAVTNAIVKVTDNTGKVYEFKDTKNEGKYIWTPSSSTEVMGAIGKTYTLRIDVNGESYQAVSELKRVPKIDSIVYKYEDSPRVNQTGDNKPKQGYDANFYAKDFVGVGDCYRVKVYKNGKMFSGADNIVIAYDALLNKSSVGDGLMFILPLRRAISPELYAENDKLKVELNSITEAHFDFWTQFRTELNNTGLFSTPAARIPCNVVNISATPKKQAAGWFGTSAVSTLEVTIDKNKAVKQFND